MRALKRTPYNQELEAMWADQSTLFHIIKTTPAMIVRIAKDGTTLAINPAITRLTGYSAAELLGQNWWKIFYPDNSQAEVIRLLEDFKNKEVVDYRMTMTIKNRSQRTISWSSSNVRDASKEIVEVIGIGIDVTDRVAIESELALKNIAMDASGGGILIGDAQQPDLPIIYANKSFLELTGYSAVEVIGKNCRFLQGTDREQPGRLEIRRAIERGKSTQVELRNYRKDGSLFWNQVQISPVKDLSGRISHFIGIQTDVTEVKRLVSDLQSEIQIRKDFIAILSHDLKNPLTSILLNCSLLQKNIGEGNDASPSNRLLESIHNSGFRMMRMLTDLLDFLRISTQGLPLSLDRVDVEDLLKKAYESFSMIVKAKGVQLEYVRPAQKINIRGDFERLIQAISNLIGNAIKFTPPGGRISLGAEKRNGEVVIFCSDTGQGIPKDQLEKVFEPYWQANSSASRTQGGLGLGLYIVKMIVLTHRGRVWIESVEGHGSTFYFSIPMNDDVNSVL